MSCAVLSVGIPVQLAVQSSGGQLLCASGAQLLCGVVLSGAVCTLVEVPHLPLDWLLSGPQRCLRWLDRTLAALPLSPPPSAQLRAMTALAVRRLFPDELTAALLPALISDLRFHISTIEGAQRESSSSDPSATSAASPSPSSALPYSCLPLAALNDAISALEGCSAALQALQSRLCGEADAATPHSRW